MRPLTSFGCGPRSPAVAAPPQDHPAVRPSATPQWPALAAGITAHNSNAARWGISRCCSRKSGGSNSKAVTPTPPNGLDFRRHVPHGLRPSLSRGGAGASRLGRRILDRPHAGDEPSVQGLRQGDRLCHHGADPSRPEGLSRRAAGDDLCGVAGVRAVGGRHQFEGLEPVVDLQEGRRLAASLRAEEQHQRAR